VPIDEASETWLEAALNSWLLVFATALLHGVVIYVLWNDYTSAGLVKALAAYTVSMGILTFLLAGILPEHLKKYVHIPGAISSLVVLLLLLGVTIAIS